MQQINSSSVSDTKDESPLISMVKSFVMGVWVLMDVDAYRNEMVRYENELKQNSRHTNNASMNIEAGERDAETL